MDKFNSDSQLTLYLLIPIIGQLHVVFHFTGLSRMNIDHLH